MYAAEQTFSGNPIKEERQRTNTPFIIVFSLIILGWIVVAIIVFSSERPPELNQNWKKAISIFEQLYIRFSWSFPICISMSALIAMVYVYSLSQPSGKIIIDAAVYLICVWMLIILLSAAVILTDADVKYSFMFILVFLYAAYLIISFYCARNVGTPTIFDIIQDSCRAMIRCPAIPVFVCAMSIVIALIISFTIFIVIGIMQLFVEDIEKELFETIENDNLQNNEIKHLQNNEIKHLQNNLDLLTFYLVFIIYGAVTIMNFIINFTHIVMSGCVIDWYWMKDQGLNTPLTLLDSIKRTLGFHLGTLAFASIPLLSWICFVYQICKRQDDGVVKIYNIVTRFFSQMCVFLYIQDFALTQTAIYGHDYSSAILAAHNLVAHNNHEINLAVTEVSTIITLTGCFFIGVPFLFGNIGSSYSVLIPFLVIMTRAPRALLVNKMIIDSNSETMLEEGNGGEKIAFSEMPREPLELVSPKSPPQSFLQSPPPMTSV